MDAGGAVNGQAAAAPRSHGGTSSALAIVPAGSHQVPASKERAVAIVSNKEIDEMHGDEIARRLAMFAQSAPTGLYSKPRGRCVQQMLVRQQQQKQQQQQNIQ
jgi:hypothetical protein